MRVALRQMRTFDGLRTAVKAVTMRIVTAQGEIQAMRPRIDVQFPDGRDLGGAHEKVQAERADGDPIVLATRAFLPMRFIRILRTRQSFTRLAAPTREGVGQADV